MLDLNLVGLFWQVGYSHARRESVESQGRTSRLASSLGPASVPTLDQFHQTLRLYKNRHSREVAAKRPFDAGVGLDGRFIFTASDSALLAIRAWAIDSITRRRRRIRFFTRRSHQARHNENCSTDWIKNYADRDSVQIDTGPFSIQYRKPCR
jgi:hypothetical protein